MTGLPSIEQLPPQPNGVDPPSPGPAPASTKYQTIPCNKLSSLFFSLPFSSTAQNFLCCLLCAKGDFVTVEI